VLELRLLRADQEAVAAVRIGAEAEAVLVDQSLEGVAALVALGAAEELDADVEELVVPADLALRDVEVLEVFLSGIPPVDFLVALDRGTLVDLALVDVGTCRRCPGTRCRR
jgi:hypothetical protein